MQGIRRAMRGAAALVLAVLSACDNEIPTATGVELFPGGRAPTTVSLELPATAFLLSDTVFTGFSDPRLTPYLLVANRFDGALTANTLARLTGFPDSVTFTSAGAATTQAISTFAGGRVVVRVDTLAASPRSRTTLRLWELDQAWDSSTVTWELAVNRPGAQLRWRTPGGTPARLLAEAAWTPRDTLTRDTVTWQIDSLAVRRIAGASHPGLLITVNEPNTRLQLSQVSLVARARPAGRADTLIDVRVSQGPQTFVYTPAAPASASVLRLGGPTGDRAMLRFNLAQTVPACADPATPGCARVPLRDVTLNGVQLLLEPLVVPGGFRPLSRVAVSLRRVVEPQLGRLAPLGELLASDTVPVSAFGVASAPVAIDLTSAVLNVLADTTNTTQSLSAALLADTEVPEFGMLWFSRRPRLRLIYTLPLRPALP